MAEVIHLAPGASPPEDRDWVLVSPTPAGKHDVSMSVAHSKGITFYYDTGMAPVEFATQRATAWADKHGISAVYVQGTPNA
jgi:hypothetical protein